MSTAAARVQVAVVWRRLEVGSLVCMPDAWLQASATNRRDQAVKVTIAPGSSVDAEDSEERMDKHRNLLDISAAALAEHLTLRESKMYRSIQPPELLNMAWKSSNKYAIARNVVTLVERTNKVRAQPPVPRTSTDRRPGELLGCHGGVHVQGPQEACCCHEEVHQRGQRAPSPPRCVALACLRLTLCRNVCKCTTTTQRWRSWEV